MDTYASDCVNIYDAGTAGDFTTQADACAPQNCQSIGQNLENNGYTFGGACSPFTDPNGVMQAANASGNYGFQSDGTNWYYEDDAAPNDQLDPQTACKNPYTPYSYPIVGQCSGLPQQTENFELFGMSKDKV